MITKEDACYSYFRIDAPINWQGESGLLNEEMLQKILEQNS